MKQNLSKLFDQCERIGVIGSPSSTTELNVDLLGTAVGKRLVGTLSAFKYDQDGSDHYAIAQITEVKLRNVWSEDPTMRGLIRQRGRVDPVTERQDTHNATMSVSAVFAERERIEGSVFGTVPSTGTSIRLVDQNLLNGLLQDYLDQVYYLGRAYGTELLLPMWFKHFGSGAGGADEAYHIGVFGKTGSGKSVMSKMIMLAYAKHKEMSIIVLDPQGEFSKIRKDAKLLKIVNEKYNRAIEVFDLSSIVLTDDSRNFRLFSKILLSTNFLDRIAVYNEDNKARAWTQILRVLLGPVPGVPAGDSEGVMPWNLADRSVFDRVWAALGTARVQSLIYSGIEYRERMATEYRDANPDDFYAQWSGIARLFSYASKTKPIKIKELVQKVAGDGQGAIVIIDLSESDVPEDIYWNEEIKLTIINKILQELQSAAEDKFRHDKLLNTLVVIDEAHRLAPREHSENEQLEAVKRSLVDGALTTRKYGLGWMFISQTLSSLDEDILSQLRIYMFGFGLGWGAELRALRDIIGGRDDAIRLYQMFKDPQSALGKKEYSFMTYGPASPLSFSGSPLFLNALQYPDEVLRENHMLEGQD